MLLDTMPLNYLYFYIHATETYTSLYKANEYTLLCSESLYIGQQETLILYRFVICM